jgi:hypothetical protein
MNAHVPRREVRFELPDPDAPGFREEIARQVDILAEAEEEAEIAAWKEAALAEVFREIDAAEQAAEDAASGV